MTQGLPLPENSSLVYRHVRPDKNEVFYVGISLSDPQRPYDIHGRNKHWQHIVNLCGGNYRVDILFQGLSCQEAWEKEREFIAIYGRRDLGTGTLVNMTEGGEGNIGRTYSEETRKKISKGVSGERHGMYGKTHSDEAKKKIGEAGKGRKMADYVKQKLRASKAGKPAHPNSIKGSVEARQKKYVAYVRLRVSEIDNSIEYFEKHLKRKNQIAIKNISTGKVFNSLRGLFAHYRLSDRRAFMKAIFRGDLLDLFKILNNGDT